jgi:hypothetical protein
MAGNYRSDDRDSNLDGNLDATDNHVGVDLECTGTHTTDYRP